MKVKLKLCNMNYLWARTALFWSSSKSALQGRPKVEGWTAERILWQTQLKKSQSAGCKATYTTKMSKSYQKYLQVASKVVQKANYLAVERTVLEVRKVYCDIVYSSFSYIKVNEERVGSIVFTDLFYLFNTTIYMVFNKSPALLTKKM